MTRAEKIEWMLNWCKTIGVKLELNGDVGIGRECVGILADDKYPDYIWYSEDYSERLDNNDDVWTPEDAYHKHPCVAVLGTGEAAEGQLYDWLVWFHDNDFKLETGDVPRTGPMHPLQIMMGQDKFARMVS